MRLQHIIEQTYYRPWFITPEGYASILSLVDAKLYMADKKTEEALALLVRQREDPYIDGDGIGHVSILGVLGNKLSQVEESCGNTDYQRVATEIAMLQELGARAIMFNIDSPGGSVAGNAELADLIGEVKLPKLAYTDSRMCSAAYNIAASCDYIFASKSSIVGSIGCIIPWIDKSQMWSDAGLKFDPITNKEADLKSAMHGPSLSDDQRAYLQEHVQEAFAQFKANVLKNRAVPSDAMRGQMFLATQGIKKNLIDGVTSKDQARNKLVMLSK